MVKRAVQLCALMLALNTVSQAQLPQVTLSGNIAGTRTLSADTAYVLQGFVNVQNGGIIRILPGTVIFGDSSSSGTLIVQRGGKIWANGEPNRPIVFTSKKAVGQRAAGDWGGVILTGISGTNIPGDSAGLEGAGTWCLLHPER
jgi:hypothetical protein